MDLADWTGAPRPPRAAIAGRYVRLEPLGPDHAGTLYEASTAPGQEDRFRWLFETPPADRAEFDAWLAQASVPADPLVFAVVDAATGRAEGRQALMRIDTAHGVIEIGGIMWGPALQRTRMATEALFLTARHVFDLGYRRLEWKCNALNAPSIRAATRFGFRPEGVFRQHMVVKGASRDTAWFAMTDGDWARLRPIYEAWLDPANFDAAGRQRAALEV
ncbi:GNAT family N-acetyltransferase [Paracoccus liaowanqingii]|uniref:GNAT family N-acetyltransferase n=1 Tax=Paracoccus liaowanqingii TaxID=2560053 RepID=A0A4P7HLB1_9RHOB|nr:GNAT family protein [Paracoccus liaowanqingii]QBX34994.1 GNAT family N-acetyltransferase [Paracoccus liaowanqingii]